MSKEIHEDIVEAYKIMYGLAGRVQLEKDITFWMRVSKRLKSLDRGIKHCENNRGYDKILGILKGEDTSERKKRGK